MQANEQIEPSRGQRIWLHLVCPCRNWQQIRFHLRGIFREFGVVF